MIIAPKRDQVIDNIKSAILEKDFNRKVEVDDPVLDSKEKKRLLENYIRLMNTPVYGINHFVANRIVNYVSKKENHTTIIDGLDNIKCVTGSAIITSNHFNPLDNTVIRKLARKRRRRELYIVSQESNLAMKGLVGYMMNFVGLLPISSSSSYMVNVFEPMLKDVLEKNNYVLIYPEQEMWFNYRKPRPHKRGAYYYAAKYGVPIISCFVEIKDRSRIEKDNFHKIKYILHILEPIYLDPNKSVRENSIIMDKKDYNQKVAAYEKAYGKKLDYTFDKTDIAGWITEEEEAV